MYRNLTTSSDRDVRFWSCSHRCKVDEKDFSVMWFGKKELDYLYKHFVILSPSLLFSVIFCNTAHISGTTFQFPSKSLQLTPFSPKPSSDADITILTQISYVIIEFCSSYIWGGTNQQCPFLPNVSIFSLVKAIWVILFTFIVVLGPGKVHISTEVQQIVRTLMILGKNDLS